MTNFYLILAITAEVIATSALKFSDGFSKFWPSLVVVLGYGLAFYLMSLVFRTMPVGIVYAIWSGAGVALITLVGAIFLKEIPDWPAILGMLMIVGGVLVIKLFSKMASL